MDDLPEQQSVIVRPPRGTGSLLAVGFVTVMAFVRLTITPSGFQPIADAYWVLLCGSVVYVCIIAPKAELRLSSSGLEFARGKKVLSRTWSEITAVILASGGRLGIESRRQQTLWLDVPGRNWQELADAVTKAHARWSEGASLPRPELVRPLRSRLVSWSGAAALFLASAWVGWPVWARPRFSLQRFYEQMFPTRLSGPLSANWLPLLVVELTLFVVAGAIQWKNWPSPNEQSTPLTRALGMAVWATSLAAIMTGLPNLAAVYFALVR